ncbi:Unknown protein, partial [Striga hermonthica]
LGGPSTVSQIKDSRRIHHPHIIFFLKQKKNKKFTSTVCNKLGFINSWHLVEPEGSKGCLLVMWDQSVEVRRMVSNGFCIQMEVRGMGLSDWCWLIFVYMSSERSSRVRQWEFLLEKKSDWGNCWAIAGDWNHIFSNEEKKGGRVRAEASFLPFRDFIMGMDMYEQIQKGAFFTWGNNRRGNGYVEERLDKVFTSHEWLQRFPKMEVSNFYRCASDHNVILYDTEVEQRPARKRFIFDKNWVKLEGIEEAVEEGWGGECEGSDMFKVHQKVKFTRRAILSWYNPIKRNNEKLIQTLTAKMEVMRADGGNVVYKAFMEEEQYWRAKSRALWLKAGDKNTRFFHAFAAQRRKSNAIQRLLSGSGEVIEEKQKLEDYIHHAELIMDMLQRYQKFAGQKVNLNKSSMFLSRNCSVDVKEKICSILSGVMVKRSTRYLGLSLRIGASKHEAFQFVVDTVRTRISSWKNHLLSTAGKEVM